jgi:hypothetical protein
MNYLVEFSTAVADRLANHAGALTVLSFAIVCPPDFGDLTDGFLSGAVAEQFSNIREIEHLQAEPDRPKGFKNA